MGTDLNGGRGFKPRRGTKEEARTFGVRRAWRQDQARCMQGAGREEVGQASALPDCASP